MTDRVLVHTTRCARPVTGAPVFVLVHGIGASHRYFGRLQQELARSGDVHAVDLPGFGGLPRPHRALSIEDLAHALADRLDALGLAQAVLVGHSMVSRWSPTWRSGGRSSSRTWSCSAR